MLLAAGVIITLILAVSLADGISLSNEVGHDARGASRMVKSTALELFDEDANTESPTVSQKSKDNIGLFTYRANSLCYGRVLFP